MLLGFRTELDFTNVQRIMFLQHCGVARHAWNNALHYTKLILDVNQLCKQSGNDALKIKFPSAIDLNKWHCANVKAANPWYYESSKAAHQNAIRALRDAWDRCFKKVSKPPRFKKKGQHDSFTLDGTIKILGSNHIQVPVIGALKTFEGLPQGVKPKNVTISRDGLRWFISFRVEVEPVQTEKTNQSVGIDLGLKVFATLSTGEVIKAPVDEYGRIKAKISKLQYLSRNKQRGSKHWRKAQNSIQRLHYRAKCLRNDFLHKTTTYLCKTFGVICLEDLNIKGMMSNHKLAGAIGLMGWFEFSRQCEYKSRLYGSEVQYIGQWEPSSKTCSECGWKNSELTLKDRVFDCLDCGHCMDRDHNAAINIERIGLGRSPLRNVEPEVPTPGHEAFNKQLNLFV